MRFSISGVILLDMYIDLEALKAVLISDFESLYRFNFSCLNPVFWLVILILYIILRRFWEAKSAFTFLLLTAVILLLTSAFEGRIAFAMAAGGEQLDPGLIRLITLLIIGVLFLAYTFLR